MTDPYPYRPSRPAVPGRGGPPPGLLPVPAPAALPAAGSVPHVRGADRGADAGEMPSLDAWLYRHQSEGLMCMTVGLLARFEGAPPAVDELRSRVLDRWGGYDRLRLRPEPTAGGAVHRRDPEPWPRWRRDAALDPAGHVVAEAAAGGREEIAAALLADPLEAGRPPWSVHLLPDPGGFALLLRAHHALLDGRSLVILLRALLDGPGACPSRPRNASAASESAVSRRALLRAVTDVFPRARPLSLHVPVDAGRAVAFSRIPADVLDAARDAVPSGRRATANSVFLAATGRALRAAGLAEAGTALLPGVCAMVPVDVRAEHERELLGNKYATVRVPLPTGRADPRESLTRVDHLTRAAVRRRQAHAQALLVSRTPRRRGILQNALARYADSPRYASLLCSSVRTDSGPIGYGAAELTGVSLLPPLSPRHPVAAAVVVHEAVMHVAVVTDRAHRALAASLADAIRDAVDELGGHLPDRAGDDAALR